MPGTVASRWTRWLSPQGAPRPRRTSASTPSASTPPPTTDSLLSTTTLAWWASPENGCTPSATCADAALLTHMGKYQGRVAGDVIAARAEGRDLEGLRFQDIADHDMVPAVVFSDPQVASVGLTEAVARQRGLDLEVLDFDIGAVAGAALQRDGYEGHARLVVDRRPTPSWAPPSSATTSPNCSIRPRRPSSARYPWTRCGTWSPRTRPSARSGSGCSISPLTCPSSHISLPTNLVEFRE